MVLKKFQVRFLLTNLLQGEQLPEHKLFWTQDAITKARFIRANASVLDAIEQDRQIIIKSHCETDENGLLKIDEKGEAIFKDEESKKKAIEETTNLFNEDFTIGIDKDTAQKLKDYLYRSAIRLNNDETFVLEAIVNELDKEIAS